MPKHSKNAANEHRLARLDGKNPEVARRNKLLEDILDESSSVSLNDASNHLTARSALAGHGRLLDLLDELKQLESPINPALPQRSNEAWTNFFNWLNNLVRQENEEKSHLNELFSILTNGRLNDDETTIIDNKIESEPKQVPNKDDCSLMCKVPIKRGDTIFKIHRRCMMTSETALKDDDLGDFIRNDSIASAMQNVVLVLHLLNEHCKKDKSFWSSYISILPNNILPVLVMTKADWARFLPSAHIHDALKMIRSIARQYSYFYKRLQTTSIPLKSVLTFEYYCWGVSIVCSRQNEIPPSDRQAHLVPVLNALIPLLDMCNHDPGSNQPTFERNHSVLVAGQDFEANQEIRINYGARTSGEFYIHNGFVPEQVAYDMVPINLSIVPQDPLFDKKVKLLKILNMPKFGRFKLVANNPKMRHKRDPHLTMFLIVNLLNEDNLDMILASENPVGLADELYEHVQYNKNLISKLDNNGIQLTEQQLNESGCSNTNKIISLGESLTKSIQDYSSKRAIIGVALIDRALEEPSIDGQFSRLLQHEREIYKSYIISQSSTT